MHRSSPGRLAVTAALLLLGVLPSAVAAPPAAPIDTSDYAKARQGFRTHLVREGPSPQAGEPLKTPQGATRLEYDATRHLVAFVSALPKEGKPRPAVLFLHGGFAYGADDWEMAEPYRAAGFITMMPILRGENGQTGHFTLFYEELDDVLAAARTLAHLPGVDPQRVFISGHSVGGTLTLLAAMATDTFRAATSFSGSPNQLAFTQGQPELVPFDASDRREFVMRSPRAFATSFKCPTRIFYGSEEAFFAQSSQDTAKNAAAQGADVQALAVPGDHFSAVPEEMRRSIEFFQGLAPRTAPANPKASGAQKAPASRAR